MAELESCYRTGQLARALGVSSYQIRRLAETGSIEAEYSGKQWRIPARELERLRRDGVPEIPANTGEAQSPLPRPKPASASPAPGLVAEPSPDVVAAHEEADITAQQVEIRRHKVEGLKLHKEAVELGDFFRARRLDREQAAADQQAWVDTQARAERAQQEAIRAEQRRREWMNGWLAFALDAPNTRWRWEWSAARGQVEVEAAIHDEVLPILEKTSSDEPDHVVKPLVLAAVERVIGRWQRGNETQQILTSAGTDWLPYAARGTRTELSIWQVRSIEAADAAMRGLRADASIEELRCVAKAAAGKIVAEFGHIQTCEKLVSDLRAQIQGATADELEAAQKEVRTALAGLPLTASQHDRERARDGAIAGLRQRIAARAAGREAEQARIAAEEARQSEARLKLTNLLSLVYEDIGDKLVFEGFRDGFFDRWNSAEKLERKIRPLLLQELLHDADLSAAQIGKRVSALVDAHLDVALAA
ncbi:MAG: helix-turn-helix domain-containing protein [Bryobacterales bacterium]|nr:helix-turn-helix domain-containing protein [Bryobacterales bacterium]